MTARIGGYEFFKISESLSKRKGLKLTMMFPQKFIHPILKNKSKQIEARINMLYRYYVKRLR